MYIRSGYGFDIPLWMYVNNTVDLLMNLDAFPGEYPMTSRQRLADDVTQTRDPPRVAYSNSIACTHALVRIAFVPDMTSLGHNVLYVVDSRSERQSLENRTVQSVAMVTE